MNYSIISSKDKYSSKERMERFYSGKRIDRVPVVTNATMYAGRLCGLSAEEFYYHPRMSYDAQDLIIRMHGCDGNPVFDVPFDALLNFGGEVYISDKAMMLPKVTKYPINKINEAIDFGFPSLEKQIMLQKELEFIEIAKEAGQTGVTISTGSPMTMLFHLIEPELLLRWLVNEKELIHKLMNQVMEWLLTIADLKIGLFGVDNCSVYANYPGDSNELISPKMFEQYSLPYNLRIYDEMKKRGITEIGIHICGTQKRNLPYYKELNLPEGSLISCDNRTDVRMVSDYLGSDYIYAGNVPSDMFLNKNSKAVFDYSSELIQAMKYKSKGFILQPSCDLPLNALPQNVEAMIMASKKYGYYEK